jgi:hypothetical protein
MTIKGLLAGAALAVAISGVMASGANAAIMHVVVTGTAVETRDLTHIFGTPTGGTLDGLTFRANYTYDTTLGTSYPAFPGVGQALEGGGFNGTSSPITHASLTLNGVTQDFSAAYSSTVVVADYTAVATSPSFSLVQIAHNFSDDPDGTYNFYLSSTVVTDAGPITLDTPFSGGPAGGNAMYSGGLFSITKQIGGQDPTVDTEGGLEISSITVTEAVPEPATWALMLSGFGGLGVALRRRRVLAAAA